MIRRGAPDRPHGTEYEMVGIHDINVGDVVILESKHYYYKTGKPADSDYFRTVVGEHPTVSGMMKHLVSEPDATFLSIPPWQMGWIYAGNGEYNQMWRAKDGTEIR